MRNSVNQIVEVLQNSTKPLPENAIMQLAFHYDRNSSMWSNKKYADMLRRGVRKGLIERIEMTDPDYPRCTVFYK